MSTATFQLNDSWRQWLAENHLLGTSENAIIDVLVAQGLPEPEARAELDAVRSDSNLVAAGWVVQRLRKLESLLQAQQSMRRLDPAYGEVPRRSGLTRDEFLTQFYAANLPVV